MKERVLSIDIIKILSIVGVLLIHILGSKSMYGGVFWYAQAVPLFMIIMGYNSKLSFPSINKMALVFTPYILTYMISLLYVILIAAKSGSWGGNNAIHYLPIGFLPAGGPGEYWIPLFFISLFFIPILNRFSYKHGAIKTLIICVLVSYLFELFCSMININKWLYVCNPIRYSVCIQIGIVLKTKKIKIIYLLPLAALSIVYLYLINYSKMELPYLRFENGGWKSGENCLSFFYSWFLYIILSSCFSKVKESYLTRLGRYTYTIFLFQIIWFSIFYGRILSPYNASFAIPICVIGGVLLDKVSKKCSLFLQ